MTTLHATAKLVKGYRIDVDDGRAHAICLDQSAPSGTDMGPSALDLALMSYAGCYATIFVMTINKMRLSIQDLEVKTTATKTEQAGTITEANFEIAVKADIPEDRIQRAHRLAKDCPVGKIFDKAGVKTQYTLKIQK
jgi:uncharacterized OsmC-like protein